MEMLLPSLLLAATFYVSSYVDDMIRKNVHGHSSSDIRANSPVAGRRMGYDISAAAPRAAAALHPALPVDKLQHTAAP